MMRVFGAYRVGHAADGSPLTPPRAPAARPPANSIGSTHLGPEPPATPEGAEP